MGDAIRLLEGIVTWAREPQGPESERSPSVIALETSRVNRSADVFDRAIANSAYTGRINPGHIILSCALGWFDSPHRTWKRRTDRHALATGSTR